MSDFDFDNLSDGMDSSEFSLEAILAEFRSEKRPAAFSAPEPASQPVILDEHGDNIGAASISSVDDLLGPEPEPGPEAGTEPEEEAEEEPIAEEEPETEEASEAEPAPEEKAEPAAEAEASPVTEPSSDGAEDYDTGGYDEAGSGDLYAGAELPVTEAEPEPPRRAAQRAASSSGCSPA
jgi:hypothetical protein